MDTLAPNSVSIVMCDQVDVNTMLNHKIKADLCLIVFLSERTFFVNELLAR